MCRNRSIDSVELETQKQDVQIAITNMVLFQDVATATTIKEKVVASKVTLEKALKQQFAGMRVSTR